MSRADAAMLWERLKQENAVAGEAPVASASVTPWYIRAMLGIAGWLGALFLLGFVAAGFAFIMKSAGSALIVGALVCTGATVLYRARAKGDFANQFAFAVSLAGQGLIAVGFAQLLGTGQGLSNIALPLALLELALFLLIPNFLHRVWSAWTGGAALVVALDGWGFYPYTQALVLAAFSWAWLNEFSVPGRSQELRALGYGLTLMVVGTLVLSSGGALWHDAFFYRMQAPAFGGAAGYWIGAALIGLIVIWVVRQLLVRSQIPLTSAAAQASFAGALIAALVSLKAPGIGITLVMLLLGFGNANRVLTGLGILGLIAYWSFYYYSLQMTLLQKSALLVCAGAVLIIARLAMQRRWPAAKTGGPHA